MTDVQVVELQEQRTAVVHEVVPIGELTGFFGRAFGAVASALAQQGQQPAGPPFGYFHGRPTDTVDVAAGFPVTGIFQPSDGVIPGVLPACQAYECTHVGPYDTLEKTYSEIEQRIRADGSEPSDDMWEYYLSDPAAEPDPAGWRTRILWPVDRRRG
jgi:effector-binding domain-containing protein